MRPVNWATCLLLLSSLGHFVGHLAAAETLDVPMDPDLLGVVIRFGLNDAEPADWEGTYRLSDGRVVASAGWRFAGDDFATASQFQFKVRRFYPRFWNLRGSNPKALVMEPNGLMLTLAGLSPSAVLEVNTSRGNFTVPVGKLEYRYPQKALDGNVEFRRVPVSRQIVKAPTEDAYPSAVIGPQGRLSVAYIAFTHGQGFEKRPPVTEPPDDFSSLKAPAGGDRIMFTELQGSEWTEPIPLTEPGGDLFGTAIACDGQGRLWVVWSANVDDNWDLYGRYRAKDRWSAPMRITTAPGADFNHAATTDSEGNVWLAWQSFGQANSDVCAARQEGDAFGKPTAVAAGPANDWAPAIAASEDGRVAVAWDSYEKGDYDVLARIWKDGAWGANRVIAASGRKKPERAWHSIHGTAFGSLTRNRPRDGARILVPTTRARRRRPFTPNVPSASRYSWARRSTRPKRRCSAACPCPRETPENPSRPPAFWRPDRNWRSTSAAGSGSRRGYASTVSIAPPAAPG
jgi:hypothetical protein